MKLLDRRATPLSAGAGVRDVGAFPRIERGQLGGEYCGVWRGVRAVSVGWKRHGEMIRLCACAAMFVDAFVACIEVRDVR